MPVPGEARKFTSVGANGSELTIRQDRSSITSREMALEMPAWARSCPARSSVLLR